MNKHPAKTKRVNKGWSQGDLADLTKIPRYKISLYESGALKLREDELRRLRKALGFDLSNPEF